MGSGEGKRERERRRKRLEHNAHALLPTENTQA